MTLTMNARYTIMLLDDHQLMRLGVTARLSRETDFEVIGDYGTSQEFFSALSRQVPHVAVIDYSLAPTDIDGLNLIRSFRARCPESKLLVLSSHYNPATVAQALQAGCNGFSGKTQDMDELVTAIRITLRGDIYLHPAMAQIINEMIYDDGRDMASDSIKAVKKLTPREYEVLRCLLDGMTVNEIAQKFFRSANTISTQKKAAFNKLGIRSDGELFKMQMFITPP